MLYEKNTGAFMDCMTYECDPDNPEPVIRIHYDGENDRFSSELYLTEEWYSALVYGKFIFGTQSENIK